MPDPWKDWMWLRSSQVQTLLSDLATGRLALTHEALHLLANWRTVAYLRDLLLACGALRTVDKQLLHFETWLAHRLAELDDDPHQRLLRRFATWKQLPRLRARADRNPLTTSSRRFASEQFTAARTFLAWVDGRGGTLGACTQADIDIWHATHLEHQKNTVRAFLNWAMKNRIMIRLDLPVIKPGKGNQISQHRRLELIRRAVTDDHLPLRTRVAACLMLLYAQPVSRLRRPTIDDVIRQDGQVLIRLGHPPAPVPEPFAALLLELAGNRENMTTATNPSARWLFPGQRAGQQLNVAQAWRSCGSSGSGPPPPARQHCGTSCSRHQRPSSPGPLASTIRPPAGSRSTLARPGTSTPPETTHSQLSDQPHGVRAAALIWLAGRSGEPISDSGRISS